MRVYDFIVRKDVTLLKWVSQVGTLKHEGKFYTLDDYEIEYGAYVGNKRQVLTIRYPSNEYAVLFLPDTYYANYLAFKNDVLNDTGSAFEVQRGDFGVVTFTSTIDGVVTIHIDDLIDYARLEETDRFDLFDYVLVDEDGGREI